MEGKGSGLGGPLGNLNGRKTGGKSSSVRLPESNGNWFSGGGTEQEENSFGRKKTVFSPDGDRRVGKDSRWGNHTLNRGKKKRGENIEGECISKKTLLCPQRDHMVKGVKSNSGRLE